MVQHKIKTVLRSIINGVAAVKPVIAAAGQQVLHVRFLVSKQVNIACCIVAAQISLAFVPGIVIIKATRHSCGNALLVLPKPGYRQAVIVITIVACLYAYAATAVTHAAAKFAGKVQYIH